MIAKLRISLVLSGFSLFLFTVGCDKQERTSDIAQDKSGMIGSLTDKPLKAYQNELLDIAFKTASAIPIQPHIKDRSKAQERVVEAILELDQPLRALSCVENIDNWRRGSGYGNLAFFYARHGYANETQQYSDLALQFSESAEDWHKDHIRVKIANAYTLLGENQQADQYVKDLADVESLKVAKVTAMIANDDHFNEQMKALDALLVSSNFDIVENALKVCANLFNRFYDNTERRSFVEEKIKTSWYKLPIFKRVELLTDMAGFALDHADQAKGLELVNDAQFFIDGAQWRPEHRIPMISELVKLRFRAGDRQKARTDADALLALFDLQRDKIVNIERAGALRPLAEAYQSMGDTAVALAVYKRAVEEGVENPNSRPRAEDLSATCLSMALHGVEPDAELLIRIRQINDGLGDPW